MHLKRLSILDHLRHAAMFRNLGMYLEARKSLQLAREWRLS